MTGSSANLTVRTGTTNRADDGHTHTLNSATTDSETNLPSYRDLRVIKYNSGIPATIPSGAIAIFDSLDGSIPSGWTRYSAEDTYFVRGNSAAAGTGGNNIETHVVTVNINTSPGAQGVPTTTPRTLVANVNHDHTVANGATSSVDKRPPYINVVLAKANANTAIPGGMIAMFDATPSANWTVVSGVGQAFYGRFIMGASAYGSTGGATTHTPPNLNMVTGVPTATGNARTD